MVNLEMVDFRIVAEWAGRTNFLLKKCTSLDRNGLAEFHVNHCGLDLLHVTGFRREVHNC